MMCNQTPIHRSGSCSGGDEREAGAFDNSGERPQGRTTSCRRGGVPVATFNTTIEEVLSRKTLTSVYQPIVELDRGRIVAYEALVRGPRGTALATPDALLAAAASAGLTAEFDWACRASALQGALEAGLGSMTKLFINVEPASLRSTPPPELDRLHQLSAVALSVVVEITERALVADPASLVDALTRYRAAGMGIAIDDVGADPASLALLPFVEPDVIKLDMRLVRRNTDTEIASIVSAVRADAERRGAKILAEGIETSEHLERALVLGAELGQGWLFGRPGPLPSPLPIHQRRGDGLLTFASSEPVAPTPWSLVENRRDRRTASKRMLMPMSRHVEQRALIGDPRVLLGAFQDVRYLTAATLRRYRALATRNSLVGALGVGVASTPAPGVRGGSLPVGHPITGEWTVVVVGPHDAAALIARDRLDNCDEAERTFDYVITHDRPTVIAAARALLQYIDPAPQPAPPHDGATTPLNPPASPL